MEDGHHQRSQRAAHFSSLPHQGTYGAVQAPIPAPTTGHYYSGPSQDQRMPVVLPVTESTPGTTEIPVESYHFSAIGYGSQAWADQNATMPPGEYHGNADQSAREVPVEVAHPHDTASYQATTYAPLATPTYPMALLPVPVRPPTAYSSQSATGAVRQRSRAARMLSRARAHIDSVHKSNGVAEVHWSEVDDEGTWVLMFVPAQHR
ncbi:unnamed protein product [Peniophora sp. CBMAI 1063]|nr:unnamed protein product [Peniophora sp. CBMAI 1063]